MKTSGATTAATDRRGRLTSWLGHHRLACFSTLSELMRSPLPSLMTWLVIGIALGLPTILYVALQNLSAVSGGWDGKPRVSLYLQREVTLEAGQDLARRINRRQDIEAVRFISSDEALRQFQRRAGFGEVLSGLARNPLPHAIEVAPMIADPQALSVLVAEWQADQRVDKVSVDLQWLERLSALLALAERLVSALALVLGLGVLLVMGNTIRLAIENRRQEIEVVKLVGGTNGFVRRPFLYLGFWYGLGGSVFALLLAQASLFFLSGPIELLAQSYRNDFALRGPGAEGSLLLLAAGSLLGVSGSLLAVSRRLSAIEPR